MAGEPFTILCSKAPFSMDELDILRRCGREFERLSNGERAPATAAQGAVRRGCAREESPRNRLRTGVDEVSEEARMGERPGQPGSDGAAAADSGRPRGLEAYARSGLERCQTTGERLGRVELANGVPACDGRQP